MKDKNQKLNNIVDNLMNGLSKRLTIDFPLEVYEKIVDDARRNERSVSATVRILVRKGLGLK